MKLQGDIVIPDIPMNDSQVNHLRRLLAWMRCEYMLDDDMQRGYIHGAETCVQHGFATPEQAGNVLQEKAAQINYVPVYVRQAHKMLTKALQDHERKSGIVEAAT